jgi:transcription antitermination factor NusG
VVDERELQVVRLIEKSGRAARPWPMPQIGEPVCIEHGPLTGVEGVLVGLKKHRRLVVSITLLRRSVAVEIEEQWVRPVKRRWAAPALAEMICVDSVAGRA